LAAGVATSWYDCEVFCQPSRWTEDCFVWEENDDVVEIDGLIIGEQIKKELISWQKPGRATICMRLHMKMRLY
jgi:hypothetical protein